MIALAYFNICTCPLASPAPINATVKPQAAPSKTLAQTFCQGGRAAAIADRFRLVDDWHFNLSIISKSCFSNLTVCFVDIFARGYFMMPRSFFTMGFVKDWLAGKKKLLKTSLILHVTDPT
jgi:hypothetical protein